MHKPLFLSIFAVVGLSVAASSWGLTFTFSTGTLNGLMATASRPANVAAGQIEIESADDFILGLRTTIDHATFTGLVPTAAALSSVQQVEVEIYRVFPLDSVSPASGHVPTRVNSPSDLAFDSRSSAAASLTFTASILTANFAAANSVVNGINPIPNQTTGGEGPVSGEEVLFSVTFTPPFTLPAGHYFFVPKVGLSSGNFLWLSAPNPIVAPGTPFSGDLQSWIRNVNLAPDWLRIRTDIVGGSPVFNGAFSLSGTALTLDIDGNASYDALTDGLLVIRYLFGLSGASLINGAVGPLATRTTAAQIGDYLTAIRPALDIDGNGQADALTDGLLIIRYLFGLRSASLITGAVGPGATRNTAATIEPQIQGLTP